MKKLSVSAAALGFAGLLLFFLCGTLPCGEGALTGYAQADALPGKTFEFTNGQWFDGQKFERRTMYSVDAIFSSKKPARVDEVVDLRSGYVVPPFADAHNHYIAGPHNIEKILDQYLHDGVFYAKNPASIHRDGDDQEPD